MVGRRTKSRFEMVRRRNREREVSFLPSFQSAHFCKTDRKIRCQSEPVVHVDAYFAAFPSQTSRSLLASTRDSTLAFKWREGRRGRSAVPKLYSRPGGYVSRALRASRYVRRRSNGGAVKLRMEGQGEE